MSSMGHREHGDDLFCLLVGLILAPIVDPGALFPYIRHVQKVWIEPRLSERFAKRLLVIFRSAGGNHNTVQPVLYDRFGDFPESIGGAGHNLIFTIDDILECRSVCHQRGNIGNSRDICPAVADENSYPRLLSSDGYLARIVFCLSQRSPLAGEQLRSGRSRAAGRTDRIRYVHRAGKRCGGKDARPARDCAGRERIRLTEAVSIEFQAECPGQRPIGF
jgi:hypothetical protein